MKNAGVSTKEARKEPLSHRHKVRVIESVSVNERRSNRHCVKIDRNKVWEEVIEQRQESGCREIQYIKATHSVRDKRDKASERVSVDERERERDGWIGGMCLNGLMTDMFPFREGVPC